MSRRFLASSLLIFGLLSVPSLAYAAQSQSIVVVDLYRAFRQTKEGKSVIEKLESELRKSQSQVENKQKELMLFREDLMKKVAMMSDTMKAQKQAELERRAKEYTESVQKLDMELKILKEKLEKPVLDRLNKSLKIVAEREEFDLVLDVGAGGVIWARPALDITDQLVRQYAKTK